MTRPFSSALIVSLVAAAMLVVNVLPLFAWFRSLFGEWPHEHPSAAFFFVLVLPISLFVAGIAVGEQYVTQKKERELEKLRSAWRSDRSEWQEYERKVEKEHEKNWVWDGKRQRWEKRNGFGKIVSS